MSVRREANRATTSSGSRPANQRTRSQPWLPQSSHAPPSRGSSGQPVFGIAGEEPVGVDDERFAGGAVGHEVVPDADRLEPARDLGQAQVDPGGVARVDHLAAFVDVETHRLLEHDVLAGGGRGEDVGQVRRVRRGDDDRVDVLPLEQGLDRRLRLGTEFRGQRRGARAAGDGDEPGRPGGLLGDRDGVDMGHLPGPDHPEPDRHLEPHELSSIVDNIRRRADYTNARYSLSMTEDQP